MQLIVFSRLTVVIGLLSGLSACDWVDSAGDGQRSVSVTDIFLDDDIVGDVIELDEEDVARITVSRAATGSVDYTFNWSDAPTEQGNLSTCANLDNFSEELSAASVDSACTDSNQCSLNFVSTEAEESFSEFELVIPKLKAPVGARFELSIEGSDGSLTTQSHDFCLISMNEAPDAVDDTFSITEGETLRVGSTGTNLLSNDSDDEDAGNTTYRILEQAAEEPRHASFFELGTDGSFTYQPDALNLREDLLDSFEYALTDGPFTSFATVSIRITARNLAPEKLSDIPQINIMETESVSVDFAPFFVDPENGVLTHTFSADSVLPPSGTFVLSADGLFSGTAAVGDAGSYVMTVEVSDGELITAAVVSLEIAPAPVIPPNTAPQFVSPQAGLDRTIQLGASILPISPQFIDPDGDVLAYSISRPLPNGLTIDPATGVITGVPLNRLWARNLVVTATDPAGATAQSEPFFIRVL